MSDPTAGGTGGDGGAGNPPEPNPNPAPPTPTATLTQEEVDRILGQRTAEAQRQATRRLVEELGFQKVDDLKAVVQAQRDAQKAQMSEAERLRAEAQEAKAEAEALRAEAQQERLSLIVERELTRAGAQGDPARLTRMLDVEPGADQAAVAQAVEALKKDFPTLFGAGGPALPSTQAVGGGIPVRTPTPTVDPLKLGAEKARAYEEGQRIGFGI